MATKTRTTKPKKATKTLSPVDIGAVNNVKQRSPTVKLDALKIEGTDKLRYEVLSDETVVLDHARATRYIDLPIFPGEREVSDGQVQLLFDEMRKGTFNQLLVILSTAVFEGVEYKINGQHTCWAVQFMPPKYSLTVREIKYRVDSKHQLKMLYATYDRLKARSDGHCTKVLLVDTPVMEGINVSLVTKLTSGLKFWYFESQNSRKRVTPEQVEAIVQNEVAAVFRHVALFLQHHACDSAHIRRYPVIAALFATFDKVPTVAPEFWVPVCSGTGLEKKTDPRLKLRDALMQSSISGTRTGKEHMPPETMYRICLQMWNRWRKGESAQQLRCPQDRPRPR